MTAQRNSQQQDRQEYKERQEQYFLKVFTNVMDKLSQELKLAQDRYRNIDLEIQKDERVLRLQKEVFYFREQCVVLTEKVHELESKIKRMHDEYNQMSDQKQNQYTLLIKKTKQKNALIKKIERISSDERPLTSSRKLLDQKNVIHETIGSMSRTTNNLKSKNMKVLTKNQTTRPSEEQSKTERNNSKDKNSEKQELLSIWEQCVNEAKGNNKFMKFLAKETKLSTLASFFSVEKVFSLFQHTIFSDKCCNSPKCKFNSKDTDKPTEPKYKLFKPLNDEIQSFHPSGSMTSRSFVRKHSIAKDIETIHKQNKQKPYTAYRKYRQNQPLVIPGFRLGIDEGSIHLL